MREISPTAGKQRVTIKFKQYRGVFWALSNIFERVFFWKKDPVKHLTMNLLAKIANDLVAIFAKNLHHRCLAGPLKGL